MTEDFTMDAKQRRFVLRKCDQLSDALTALNIGLHGDPELLKLLARVAAAAERLAEAIDERTGAE